MKEFKHVDPLTVGDHVIAKVEVYYIGDGTETTTEMWIGSEPIPHDEAMVIAPWMLTALGLPDLAQMQRRVESLLAMLEPLPDAMYEARAHIYERDCMGSTDEGARAIRAELKERATALEAALKELKS